MSPGDKDRQTFAKGERSVEDVQRREIECLRRDLVVRDRNAGRLERQIATLTEEAKAREDEIQRLKASKRALRSTLNTRRGIPNREAG